MDKRILSLVAEEQNNRRRTVRNLVLLAFAVVVGLGGLLYALKEVSRAQQPTKVVIDPSRLPPIRPGPQ